MDDPADKSVSGDPGAAQPPLLQYSTERSGIAAQAVVSFILGVAAFPLDAICCIGVGAGFFAIFFGMAALDTINTQPTMRGKGLAIAGIVCGAGAIVLALAAAVLMRFRF